MDEELEHVDEDYKIMVDTPKHLKYWLRHPIKTYKVWKFIRWLKNELKQSLFKEMDQQMIYGDGQNLGPYGIDLTLDYSHYMNDPIPDEGPIVYGVWPSDSRAHERKWLEDNKLEDSIVINHYTPHFTSGSGSSTLLWCQCFCQSCRDTKFISPECVCPECPQCNYEEVTDGVNQEG